MGEKKTYHFCSKEEGPEVTTVLLGSYFDSRSSESPRLRVP